ncbi:MAG: hypothetical protein CDV28_1104 [Candidatus Electronema aureum]|uniref:Uncharacterized protein n=1 Tax=Candidatus Electronema aureum TaxID=2005002 RepID=A0A521G291_9BACT|nr:MAG: hypothetical protein CDV28_1104 [Candidatus Electronema aureum]
MKASVRRAAASVNRKDKESGLLDDDTSEEEVFSLV